METEARVPLRALTLILGAKNGCARLTKGGNFSQWTDIRDISGRLACISAETNVKEGNMDFGSDQKVRFGELQEEAVNYSPMKATNPYTGKRELVILMAPDDLSHVAVGENHMELHADINAASAGFTKIQRRVLHEVLVCGLSVEIATARHKKSSVWWRRWIRDTALPQLRASLADYWVGGKLVLS